MSGQQDAAELFEQALAIEGDSARNRFLEAACAGNAKLFTEVRSLIDSDREASESAFWRSSALAMEALDLARGQSCQADGQSGETIGPYRLEQVIASGGMGTVYRAVREDENYRQQVAIKVIKRGMDSDAIVRRFRTERQILAALQHPHIARLLDGGATKDGLPYLVMEFVNGQPLDEYAASRGLSTVARLHLFLQVCAAIEFAHQNLVVHRDIKPGNILVDTGGVAKLLDFGIAKLLGPEANADRTSARAAFLTPDYASPEQIRGESVNTVSDIYSLGVLLYRLLTGCRPYQVKTESAEELLQAICEQDPPRPSTLVMRLDQKAGEADAISLRKRLRGDLDNIVLMAMRKEPARRYASAGAMAADIQRHLDCFPVSAHRDSRWYRIGKFARRNRLAVAASGSFAVFLVVFSAALAYQARAVQTQRMRADRRFADVRHLATSLVEDANNSLQRKPGTLETRQALLSRAGQYLDALAKEEGNDPDLRLDLARTYARVGEMSFDVDVSKPAYEKSLALSQGLVSEFPSNVIYQEQLADVSNRMASLERETGQQNQSLRWLEKATAEWLAVTRLHPSWESEKQLAESIGEQILPLSLLGRTDEATRQAIQARHLQESMLQRRPNDLAMRRSLVITDLALAKLYLEKGDFASATDSCHRALSTISSLLASSPGDANYRRDLWVAHHRLGNILEARGQKEAALIEYHSALGMIETVAHADPTDAGLQRGLATSLIDRGRCLSLLGRHREALMDAVRAIQITVKRTETNPSQTEAKEDLAQAYAEYARSSRRAGRLRQAREAYRSASLLFAETTAADRENVQLERAFVRLQSEFPNAPTAHQVVKMQ